MLGSSDLSLVLGSMPHNRDHVAMRAYIKSLCDIGCSVLLVMPNTKQPFDGRTSRKRNADDKAAQHVARDAGRRDWQRVKSPSGLALATTDSKKLLNKNGYLDEYLRVFGTWSDLDDRDVKGKSVQTLVESPLINIAIEVGGSGLIVVDCDTPEQLDRFYEVAGIDPAAAPPPTVVSPGTQMPRTTWDDKPAWIHHGGGHFYFTLTDEQRACLPRNTGSMVWGGADGFAMLWDRRYVLIPPSTRAEGAYELVGREYPVPDWLFDAIVERGIARNSNRTGHDVDEDLKTEIDRWAETVSWASILEPLGWTPTARPDTCGCDVWTAPGNHASPKSATAHDAGCSLGRYTETNAPLHIWTDHPGEPFDQYIADNDGRTTLSKLQAVAYIDYGGVVGEAMDKLELGGASTDLDRSLGVDNKTVVKDIDADHDPSEEFMLPGEPGSDEDNSCPGCASGECEFHGMDPDMAKDLDDATSSFSTPDDKDEAPNPDLFDCGIIGLPVIAPFSHWKDMPPPEFVIDGLLERGGLSCIIGSPGIGKSNVALDMACCIGIGQTWQGRKTLKTRVLYLPGEGLSGTVQRIKAWSHMHETPDVMIDEGLRLANDIVRVGASSEAWSLFADYVLRQNIGLVIFDTFARTCTSVNENDAMEVGRAIARFDTLRRLTNCGVVVIHHTGKHTPEVARGSSALYGAIESELLIRASTIDPDEDELRIDGKHIELKVTKQRNINQPADGDEMQLMIRNCEPYSAPYITARSGNIEFDPMAEVTLARPIEEPTIETAIRIREFLSQLPEQGATVTEIATGVRPDAYTKGRADHTKAWKLKVRMAVDKGIHFELIETATGARLGARYVAGPRTVEQARIDNATEVIAESEGNG